MMSTTGLFVIGVNSSEFARTGYYLGNTVTNLGLDAVKIGGWCAVLEIFFCGLGYTSLSSDDRESVSEYSITSDRG